MGEVGIRERVGSRKAEKKKGRRIAMSLTSEFQASLGYRTKPCHMPWNRSGKEGWRRARETEAGRGGLRLSFSTWKVKAGGFLCTHSHSELHSKFQVILVWSMIKALCHLFLQWRKSEGKGMKRQGKGRETVGNCQKHKKSGKKIQFRVWCWPCMVPIIPWRLSRPGSRAFLSYCSTSMISRGLLTRASFIRAACLHSVWGVEVPRCLSAKDPGLCLLLGSMESRKLPPSHFWLLNFSCFLVSCLCTWTNNLTRMYHSLCEDSCDLVHFSIEDNLDLLILL